MKKAFKLFVDFDKEESWLNQMAVEGHLVRKAGPLYSFTPIVPDSATVRIDYRPSMSATDLKTTDPSSPTQAGNIRLVIAPVGTSTSPPQAAMKMTRSSPRRNLRRNGIDAHLA